MSEECGMDKVNDAAVAAADSEMIYFAIQLCIIRTMLDYDIQVYI